MKFNKITVLEPKPYLKKFEKELSELAEDVKFFDTEPTSETEVINRLKGSDAVILGHTPLRESFVFDQLPGLKYIGLSSTDYSIIDVNQVKNRKIALTNVHGYASNAVAEFVFGQLLLYYRKLNRFSKELNWKDGDDYTGDMLYGKTIGIIGLGSIGSRIAEIAKSFGMSVLYNGRHKKEERGDLEFCQVDTLLQKSDIIIVSCSLNKETRFLLNRERLSRAKEKSVIVNIARADVIDYDCLADLLEKGKIEAAILDVYPKEPPEEQSKILKAKNTILTPHIAWKTEEAIAKLYETVIENLKSYLNGGNRNRIV